MSCKKKMAVRIESLVIQDHQKSKCGKRKTLQMSWEEGEKRNRGQFAQGEGINSERNPPVTYSIVVSNTQTTPVGRTGKLIKRCNIQSKEITRYILCRWNDSSLGYQQNRTVTDHSIPYLSEHKPERVFSTVVQDHTLLVFPYLQNSDLHPKTWKWNQPTKIKLPATPKKITTKMEKKRIKSNRINKKRWGNQDRCWNISVPALFTIVSVNVLPCKALFVIVGACCFIITPDGEQIKQACYHSQQYLSSSASVRLNTKQRYLNNLLPSSLSSKSGL